MIPKTDLFGFTVLCFKRHSLGFFKKKKPFQIEPHQSISAKWWLNLLTNIFIKNKYLKNGALFLTWKELLTNCFDRSKCQYSIRVPTVIITFMWSSYLCVMLTQFQLFSMKINFSVNLVGFEIYDIDCCTI